MPLGVEAARPSPALLDDLDARRALDGRGAVAGVRGAVVVGVVAAAARGERRARPRAAMSSARASRGQLEREGRAAGERLDGQAAVHALGQLAGDREAEAGALAVAGV